MSVKHPIISVTGSSGSGHTQLLTAFSHLVWRVKARWSIVHGDGFHRYDREAYQQEVEKAALEKRTFSHFHPDANCLDKLDALLSEYSKTGTGKTRLYVHDQATADLYNTKVGTFTDWTDICEGNDFLFYRGLHGSAMHKKLNIAQYMDMKIGMVPTVNLEWIRKIHRDTGERGYSLEAVHDMILRRLPDYVAHITPQFSRTDINFQRVPIVDTSNPFVCREIPQDAETIVVIRVRSQKDFPVSLYSIMEKVPGSFMSRVNTLVVPGAKMCYAMELIFEPILIEMMAKRKKLLAA